MSVHEAAELRKQLAALKAICETLIQVAKHCQYDDCGEGRYLHVHIPADHMADWGAFVKAVRGD